LLGLFVRFAPSFLLGGFARFFLSPTRFFRSGENRDLLLLAAFGFTASGFALLLDQCPLARG